MNTLNDLQVNAPEPPSITAVAPRMHLPSAALDFITAWVVYNNATAVFGKEKIDLAKSTSYTYIWRSWCKFLAIRQLGEGSKPEQASPLLATPTDVVHFLEFGPKGVKPSRPVTDITKRRYYSILKRVYDCCVVQEWIKASPVEDLAIQDRPPMEKHQGFIMSDAQFDACSVFLPCDDDVAQRNKTIVRLLMDTGMRPEELRMLRVQDVLLGLEGMPSVHIESPTSAGGSRTMPISEPTARCLRTWLKARSELGVVKRHQALLQADPHNDQLIEQGTRLFVSRSAMEISKIALLNLVREHIERSCLNAGLELPSRMGPQIIRNTCIVFWLNSGIAPAQVVAMAGLKNAKGLLHLIHFCRDAVRAKISPSNRRDDDDGLISPVVINDA